MGLSKKYYDLFIKLKDEKSFILAQEALNRAILLTPKSYYYYELALFFQQRGQWWQSVENFESALKLESRPSLNWRLAYIESLEKMYRFSKVIEVFKAFKDSEFDSSSYLSYAYALEKENQPESKEMFNKAIEFDTENNSKILGIGIFYEKRGNWLDALTFYKKEVKDEPLNSLLHYKLGLSYHRNYIWDKAIQWISYSIALDQSKAYFFYKLALTYEFQENFLNASEIYALSLNKEKSPKPEHYYRLGYTLYRINNFKDSCEEFLKMRDILPAQNSILEIVEEKIIEQGGEELSEKLISLAHTFNDLSTKEEIDEVINIAKKIKAWNVLEIIYKEILKRDEECKSENYWNLAFVQYKQKKYQEASQNFVEQKIIQKVHSLSEKRFETNKAFRQIVTYTEYLKREIIQNNCILYECHEDDLEKSQLYNLFLLLLEDKKFKKYTHIWINTNIVDKKIRKLQNVIFVKRESTLYLKYLASSKYLLNDKKFPSYFIRKKEQKYLNIGQKFNTQVDLLVKGAISQDLLHTSHIVNQKKNLEENYALRNIYLGKILSVESSLNEIIEFFFFDDFSNTTTLKENSRVSLLIYASFEPNGITSALLNLLNEIDNSTYAITLIVDKSTIIGYENVIIELAKEINVLIRSGRMLVTLEEQWIRDKFNLYGKLESIGMHNILKKAFQREFQRIFGMYKFDHIIDFNGYKTFWSTLFAFGNGTYNSIYLHNNMYEEYKVRFPSLRKGFYLYNEFTNLISVSESVYITNKKELSYRFRIEKNKFHFINNLIDFNKYLMLSKEKIDNPLYKCFMEDKRVKFINVGRLSPEKGQEKLIKAFIKLYEKNQNISLYIMGQGILEQKLIELIHQCNMNDNIILLGQQHNPYPFIKNANCMILSSLHEGQALVLLEALTLNIPCISTNIPGPSSVLKEGYGKLCDENIDAIVMVMKAFLDNKIEFKYFNPLKYNIAGIDMFNKIFEKNSIIYEKENSMKRIYKYHHLLENVELEADKIILECKTSIEKFKTIDSFESSLVGALKFTEISRDKKLVLYRVEINLSESKNQEEFYAISKKGKRQRVWKPSIFLNVNKLPKGYGFTSTYLNFSFKYKSFARSKSFSPILNDVKYQNQQIAIQGYLFLPIIKNYNINEFKIELLTREAEIVKNLPIKLSEPTEEVFNLFDSELFPRFTESQVFVFNVNIPLESLSTYQNLSTIMIVYNSEKKHIINYHKALKEQGHVYKYTFNEKYTILFNFYYDEKNKVWKFKNHYIETEDINSEISTIEEVGNKENSLKFLTHIKSNKVKKYLKNIYSKSNEFFVEKVLLFNIQQAENKKLLFEIYVESKSKIFDKKLFLIFKDRNDKDEKNIVKFLVETVRDEKVGNKLIFNISLEKFMIESTTILTNWDIYLKIDKEYRIKSNLKLKENFKKDNYDFIPYSTKYKNLSFLSIRKKSLMSSLEIKKSITFVLFKINYKGGVTKVTIDLANSLAEEGHNITLLVLEMSNISNYFPISSKVNFSYIALSTHKDKNFFPQDAYSRVENTSIEFKEYLKEHFSTIDSEYIYFPIYGRGLFLSLLEATPLKIKKIIGDHNSRRYNIYDKLLQENNKVTKDILFTLTKDRYLFDNLEKFDAIHIVNPLVKNIYNSVTDKPIIDVPNIINIATREEYLWKKRDKVIIGVGSLLVHKGFDRLIKAFSEIHMNFPEWKIEIYGEGSEKNNLENLIYELKLSDKVFLKGFTANVIEYIEKSMLLVSVSSRESFGLTMVEAMNVKTAVFSTRTTIGAKYLINNGKTGFLAKDNSVKSIEIKLTEVLKLIDSNNSLIVDIRENAFLESRNFNKENITLQWKNILNEI